MLLTKDAPIFLLTKGYLSRNPNKLPRVPHKLDSLKVISNAQCSEEHEGRPRSPDITEDMICAKTVEEDGERHQPCKGDSGGVP